MRKFTFGSVHKDWPVIPMPELVFFQEGPGLRKWQWTDSGMKVINVTNILADGSFDASNTSRHISQNEFEQKYRHFAVDAHDVVVASSGNTYGKVSRVRAQHLPMMMNTSVVRFRPHTGADLDPDYLYGFLRSHFFRNQVEAFVTGSAQPNFGPTHIKQMLLVVPPLPEQRRIASILSAYDDLIENNTRRIAILEEMARRIYEEWFVRFRFPGHDGVRMVESELGLAPESWSVQGLYDVADLTYGFPFKSNLFKEGGEGLGVIRIRDIRDDYTATRTTEDVDLKYRVADGDILVGMDGAFHMGRWAGGVAWLNQRVVRFRPKARIPRSWLYWVTEEPIKTLEATIVGTTVAHLSARDLKEMRLLVPSKAVLEAAGSVLEPMSDLELTLKKKNAVLRVTRDLLLPKLISGELDVSAIPEPEAIAA